MSWELKASSHLPYATILIELDRETGVYRAVLVAPISDTSDNQHEAMRRLADRLEHTVREIRRTHGERG